MKIIANYTGSLSGDYFGQQLTVIELVQGTQAMIFSITGSNSSAIKKQIKYFEVIIDQSDSFMPCYVGQLQQLNSPIQDDLNTGSINIGGGL